MSAAAAARRRDWPAFVRSVERSVAADPSGRFAARLPPGPRHAAVGKALLAAGALVEALRAFEGAVQLRPELAPAWGWLALAELRQGRLVDAERHLREAERSFPDWGDLHAWRAQLLLELGRPAEAAASLRRASRLGRAEPALLARARAEARAQRRRHPGSWRVLARRAAALSSRDADRARRLFDAAVAAGLSAGAFLARAEFLGRHGAPGEAVGDMTEALARRPTAALYVRRGQALVSHRDYAAALPDFERALALDPALAAAYAGRARCRMLTNQPALAARDLVKALELSPPDVSLLARRWWAEAAAGKHARAAAALARLDDPQARFARGLALLRAGKRPQAAEALASCPHRLAPLFRLLAQLPAPARREPPGVVLVGAGIDAPRTLTLEGLDALRSCDLVFKNVTAEGVDELLSVAARDWRALSFRSEHDVPRVCEEMLSQARRGKSVAFLTFANPAAFGPLAHGLLRRCREQKIAARMIAGVSSLDAMTAAAARVLGAGFGAHQIVLPAFPAAPVDTALPALVYFATRPPDGWDDYFRGLVASYPRGHRALLFDAHNDRWQDQPRWVPLPALLRLSPQALDQGMALIPPRRR